MLRPYNILCYMKYVNAHYKCLKWGFRELGIWGIFICIIFFVFHVTSLQYCLEIKLGTQITNKNSGIITKIIRIAHHRKRRHQGNIISQR